MPVVHVPTLLAVSSAHHLLSRISFPPESRLSFFVFSAISRSVWHPIDNRQSSFFLFFSSSSFLLNVTHYGHPSIHPFCAATNSCALLRTISLDGIWFFLFWFHPLFDPATCALGLIKEVELERLICLFSPVIVDWPTSIIICFDFVLRLWRTKKTKQKARMAGNTFGGGFCCRSYSASENRQSSGREESAINILFIDNSSGPSDSFVAGIRRSWEE